MFQIIYYYDSRGRCEVADWLEDLSQRAEKGNKDCRIQLEQIMACFKLFQIRGVRIGDLVKRIEGTDDLWEFRPGFNRVFFAFVVKNKIIVLHHFRKKSQKTPPKEIRTALNHLEDYRKRFEI